MPTILIDKNIMIPMRDGVQAAELTAAGHQAIAIRCDVSDECELLQMREQGSGAIVNNSSVVGVMVFPTRSIYGGATA